MKRFAKIFAVVLVISMLTSVFCFQSSAVIADSSLDIGVKLEKVTTPGEVVCADTGKDATELGNIYKVTISFVSVNAGFSKFQAAVVYDDELFDVCYGDGTDNFISYPVGDGSEFGLTAACNWLGLAADADAYDANGVGGQTSSLKIKAYGLKNSAANTTYVAEKVDPSTEQYANLTAWAYPGESVPANRGLIFTSYTCSMAIAKGLVLPWGEQDVVSVYMMLREGKTDADVNGTELRVTGIDYSGVALSNMTLYGSVYGMAKTAQQDTVASYTANGLSYVYTAPAAPSPVYAKSSQIRFNGTEASGTGSANFDIRTRAAMSAADFASICGDDAAAKTAITDIGFVYADSSITFDMAAAKTAVTNKATTAGYVYAPVEHIQRTGTEYVWTCLITSADYAAAVNAVGYITVGGTTYFFDANSTTDFSTLYDAYYSQYEASLG